ncbi:helicase-like transcription factor isoform X1 [Conger conger]|uniref:helicase-like transcription factor isoform X1 n=1 Tax=Conger conger TaxID=82655 RepID=UPI002A598C57|nr:helicase-like transcription factor isoform X1 [Conger conger]
MDFRRFGGSLECSFIDFFGTDTRETLSQAIRRSTEDTAAAAESETEANVLFGTIRGSVVGLRYYTGVVNKGEMVSLVREPHNPYDKNAVMVANVYGSQVGHIKRQLAAPMANIMDNNLAKVEGVVPFGVNNAFTMPVNLSFWGKDDNKTAVTNELKRHGFQLDKESKGGSQGVTPGVTPGRTLDQWLVSSKRLMAVPLTPEQLKNAFDKLFDDLMEDKTREMEAGEAVCTPLLPHQKQALAWMVTRENNNDLPPFWVEKNGLYFNVLTNFAVPERPESVLGGILADDMGLGKTLTTIALILTNFHNGKPMPLVKMQSAPPVPGTAATKRKCTALKENNGKGSDELTVEEEEATPSCSKRQHEDPGVIVIDSDSADSGVGVAPLKKAKTKAKSDCPSGKKKGPIVMMEDMDFAAALGGGVLEKSFHKKKAQKKSQGVSKMPSKPADSKGARATLVICPLSVLSNWLDQFEQHVRADVELNVYLYYGAERNRNVKFLAQQDVVLTTYNVLSADCAGKKCSPLHEVKWLRVVLDEGHVVRNPNAQQSKAVLNLTAERRWILSGTPIQNSLKDLWMLISFLKMKPFDVREWWNRIIERPVTLGDSKGLSHLQTLIKGITLRRTKSSKVAGRAVVQLPERRVFVQKVTLSEEERLDYETVKREGRDAISRYFREGTVLTNYADVLAILVRLRQFCCHPRLLGSSTSAAGSAADTSTPSGLRERLINKMTLVLSSGSDEECAVCLDSLRQPVITYCAHVYCKPCICEVIRSEQENAKCPLCRAQIRTKELVEYPGEVAESASNEDKDTWKSSSKVDALMSNLLRLRQEDPSIKSLVVSQFTKFLSLLEVPLREQGFSFTRLDGSMSQRSRAKAIQDFQDTAQGCPTIMLLSLKAGGVGLNLTAASRVFLMDPAWNPAAEDQCVDRCHRLGQKKDVVITKFIVKDSVEESMVKSQKRKKELVEKAFGGKKAQDRKQSRIEEIRALMEL